MRELDKNIFAEKGSNLIGKYVEILRYLVICTDKINHKGTPP